MQTIQLPRLRKIDPTKPKKKKILLLSDDITLSSGVATMSREIILGTAHVYDWVQLGAALHHPEHGKILDLSPEVDKEKGLTDSYVRIYAHTGYGSPDVLRELYQKERPDAIMIFTDPRFWGWFFAMEHEIHTQWKIPIIYNNIWDCPPAPYYNHAFYRSVDLLTNISKQTQQLVEMVLEQYDATDIQCEYVPHGINNTKFYPISDSHPEFSQYQGFVKSFKEKHDNDFLVFWNNRNVRRKQPGDVMLAFKQFCDKLTPDQAKRCALLMHTAIQDPNGTDLMAVKQLLFPNNESGQVVFNVDQLPVNVLNYMYNMADCTVNIASNEGFGLSNAESIMCGTPIVVNITGGLQDVCRFEDSDGKWIDFDNDFTSNHTGRFKKCGNWAYPVFPSERSLQGSIPTPYIYDDRCKPEDVADGLLYWYDSGREMCKQFGLEGSEWMSFDSENDLTSTKMSNRIIEHVDNLLKNWSPRNKFDLTQISERKQIKHTGITK